MKGYDLDSTQAKRYVQNKLFGCLKKFENKKLTALAGNSPKVALQQYQKYFLPDNITLVDIHPVENWIVRAYIDDVFPTHVMDVDLEETILYGQYSIMNVFYRMNTMLSGTKALLFTVSTRGSRGREKTIDTLNKTLYKNTLKAEKLSTEEIGIGSRYVQFIQHTQSLYTISKLYCYKDSSQMLSGLIIWNWYENRRNYYFGQT